MIDLMSKRVRKGENSQARKQLGAGSRQRVALTARAQATRQHDTPITTGTSNTLTSQTKAAQSIGKKGSNSGNRRIRSSGIQKGAARLKRQKNKNWTPGFEPGSIPL